MKQRLLELKKLVELSYAFGTNPPQKYIDEINYIEESLKQQITDSELEIQRLGGEITTADNNISEVSGRLDTGKEYKDNLFI